MNFSPKDFTDKFWKLILVKAKGKKPFVIKDRTKKSYRLPKIDEMIRGRRTKSEAKLLEKASQIINAPKPFFKPSISIVACWILFNEIISNPRLESIFLICLFKP